LPARHIVRDEWGEFLDSFSRLHDGWLTAIEVIERDGTVQVEARDKPLTGITVDHGDTDTRTISILIGGQSLDHAARIIHAPARITLNETPTGAHEALEIESTDGTTTRLRFRSVVLPELVDGVLLHR
jgi:Family of unknown function (DUF5335)